MSNRVLVADDHTPFHALIRRLLEPEFEVIGAVADGISLVNAALELEPDIVVTDVHMPGISGLEAVSRLFARDPKPTLVVVFLSTDSSPYLVRKALAAGGSGYVHKITADRYLSHAIREARHRRVFLCPHTEKVCGLATQPERNLVRRPVDLPVPPKGCFDYSEN